MEAQRLARRLFYDSIFKQPRILTPSLRANGSRVCAPDDRLREAIHGATKARVDCCAPLARTTMRYDFAISRRDTPEFVQENIRRPLKRAWGMPGAQCTRSRACSVVNTRVSHHGYTGSPGIPARDGVNGFLRALPGDRALLSPSSVDRSTNLTPASRRQNHTTSPSAFAPFVKGASASTASRPASVTIAIRPSSGTRRRNLYD